jgi:signal transduction histidine kinase
MLNSSLLTGGVFHMSDTPHGTIGDPSETERGELADAHAQLERCVEDRARDRGDVRERARQASCVGDAFLATVSHELRTPLNTILGWADMLEKRPDQELLLKGLPVIKRNALAQARVVDNLLDMSRIDAGGMRIETRLTDLHGAVSNAIEVVQPAAEAKRVSITRNGDDAPAIILADPLRLQQILWNLLSNAIKFTPAEGVVRVEIRTSADWVRLIVADTGIGIQPGFLKSVFAPFTQADSSLTRGYMGLGLGLTIARRLIEMHGGTVQVRSAGTNTGATFVVEFPAQHASPGELRAMDVPVRSVGASAALTGLRVLVVDDDQDSCHTTALILEAAGASTIVADSAASGLEGLLQHDVDVIVSDIAMPYRDGLEFIADVRQLLSDVKRLVPIIALTALAREEERQWILAGGCQKYIAKPVSPDYLVHCVAAAAAG